MAHYLTQHFNQLFINTNEAGYLNVRVRGVVPYISNIGYVTNQRMWFLVRFGLKAVIDIAHFGLARKLGMIFHGTAGACERIYCFNSK